jgi:hypothetical protein
LKGVAAGVVNIVRSFLALFTGRRKGASQSKAPTGGAATTVDAAGTIDATAAVADAVAIAADAVIAAANMAALTIDATAIAADAASTAGGAAATTSDTAAGAADASAAPAMAAAPAPGPARPPKPQGRKVMSSGFDMQAEIAKLSERIIEPVAGKLTAQEREQVVARIRDAFEQLAARAAAGTNFENEAASIVEPVQPGFTDAERRRVVDRLSGAMAAFCQGGLGQRAA